MSNNIHSLRENDNRQSTASNVNSQSSNLFDNDGSPFPPVLDILMPDFAIKSANFVFFGLCVAMFALELVVAWHDFGQPFSPDVPSIGPGIGTLITMRAAMRPKIQQGNIDRLIVPIFLHASLLHLFSNLAFSCLMCFRFERKWGSLRFVVFYLFSGIFGYAFSTSIDSVVKVGASGAIMGTIGAEIAFMLMNWDAGSQSERTRRRMSTCNLCCFAFFITTFLMDDMVSKQMQQPDMMNNLNPSGIDNFGHFGGLLAGFLLGLSFPAKVENPCGCLNFWLRPYIFSSVLILGISLCIYGIFQ